MDSLKRQARQAQRYRSLAAEIRRADALILYVAWREAQDAVLAAEKKVEADLRAVAERTRQQAEAATKQALAAHEMPALREAEAAAAPACSAWCWRARASTPRSGAPASAPWNSPGARKSWCATSPAKRR